MEDKDQYAQEWWNQAQPHNGPRQYQGNQQFVHLPPHERQLVSQHIQAHPTHHNNAAYPNISHEPLQVQIPPVPMYHACGIVDLTCPPPSERFLSGPRFSAVPISDSKGNFIYRKGLQIGHRYEQVYVLGHGHYGIVIQCFDHKRSLAVAVKVLRLGEEQITSGIAEAIMLQNLQASCAPERNKVIRCLKVFLYHGHLCISTELLQGGTLETLIAKRMKRQPRGFTKEELQRIIGQILDAMSQMERCGVVHADLKPGNIVLMSRETLELKIIDLGCAARVGETKFGGTVCYMAPECHMLHPVSHAQDMWSLGWIVFQLVAGFVLVDNESKSPEEIQSNIAQQLGYSRIPCPGERVVLKTRWSYFGNLMPMEVLEFIEWCLQWSPEMRMTLGQAMSMGLFQ